MIRRMTKTPAPRGPGRPPQGAVAKTVFFQIRCTEAQRDAIKELGGAQWILAKLAEETPQIPRRKKSSSV